MRVMLALATVSLLSACTWVDVEEAGQGVTLVGPEHVAHCKQLGRTTAETLEKVVGVRRSDEKLATELATIARNSAGKMGGNTIVPLGPIEEDRRTFLVYSCPPAAQ